MGNGRPTGITNNSAGTQNTTVQQMPENMAGTRYEELWKNNPWLNMKIEPSFWDKIANGLGFKTATDRSNEQIQNNAQLYYSQLMEALGEENYNSAPEQVKRQLMAGVNPDLNNGLTAGEATEIDNQASGIGIQGPETMEQISNTIQKGIQIGTNAIAMINGGFKAVIDGIIGAEQINSTLGGRDEQITNMVNAMFDDLIDDKGELYIPGIGSLGKVNKVNSDGEGDNLDSVTVVPTMTWKDWNNNKFVRARLHTQRERLVAWHQVQVRMNSYRPNLPALNKDEEYYTNESTIGKIQSYGENRKEIKEFFKITNESDKDLKLAVNKFQQDYYDEVNKSTSYGYRNEEGKWVKTESASLGTIKGRLERQQADLDKSIVDLEKSVMSVYSNLMLNIDEQINNSQTLMEKYFWMSALDIFYNHMNRSKSGKNTTIGDILGKTIENMNNKPYDSIKTEMFIPY